MGLTVEGLYNAKPHHRSNNEAFLRHFADKLDVFWFPNRTAAPWHLQAHSNFGVLLNFFPHTMKAHADGDKCVMGLKAMRNLFNLQDVDLIE